MSKKDLLRLDEELAFKLQAEEEEEERLLAQRLQVQEQEELTNEEKATLFVQFLKQRRKHFAAKRAEEKRNRPPTRAQQRSIMCTYLKNMEGWKPKSLKNKSFANIQELFDKAMKRVNTFVDFMTELVKESSKKAKTELEENKKAKAEVIEAELQSLIEIVPDEEEVAIDAIPLATKPPTIGSLVKCIKEVDSKICETFNEHSDRELSTSYNFSKSKTAKRVTDREKDKDRRKDKDCLEIKITYVKVLIFIE
ncbi:hypothetical protein Tco_0910297 [Tanacetum coccineum]|uniref:Uncharacterized protein n=1 Tax=Tanacetum coccineum TaxID=301880 RepID=A0ABQ5CU95_9ASTR